MPCWALESRFYFLGRHSKNIIRIWARLTHKDVNQTMFRVATEGCCHIFLHAYVQSLTQYFQSMFIRVGKDHATMSDKSYQVYNQECKDFGFINVDVHGEIQRLKEGSSMLILQRCVCRGMGDRPGDSSIGHMLAL